MVNEVVARDAAIEELTTALLSTTRTLRSLSQREVIKVEGLRRADIPLLRQLAEHGPLRPGTIAERLFVGPSVVSRQLTTLVADGLVTRRSDPADARADLIDITAHGRDRLSSLWSGFVDHVGTRMDAWAEPDLTTLVRLLTDLNHSLNPAVPSTELEGTA
ncbi:MarR family winged helix-turn-helix transcriptional regulator [Nocardioides alcanivorans]|uniref:MarR family winged helix-turn-helix transcriptional regulator n=1 Tax=Nocardioides alcanivorans TaxID=2897352 RepID=UPI001F241F87|nr:MarR family transcriptional regulator [Nocardioides alcanivorans]